MKEIAYNLYIIVNDGIIDEVGIKTHSLSGADEEKDRFLKSNAEKDFQDARHFGLPENYILFDPMGEIEDMNAVPFDEYKSMKKRGEEIALFEKGFQELNAPMRPFVIYSVVRDNKVIETYG